MKILRGYHLLFGMTLVALAALGTWWTIFFMRSVELEERAHLGELVHAAVASALIMGHSDDPPRPGPVDGPAPLEIIPADLPDKGRIFAPMIPRYPGLGVRPVPEAVRAIEEKVERRRIMLIGEGLLLLVLLVVLTFMLYRLILQERRHMRRMEAFVASVSHEMKTPLTGIKSMLQTFAAGRVPEAERDRLYAMGIKEAERLEHMIENVLISGHLRRGRFEVLRKELPLRELLEGFLEHRRRYLVEQPEALRLEWEPEASDLKVRGDRQALQIILENLTDNAFKYGGHPPGVTLRVRKETGRVGLSIEDKGIGFDPARAEELFVPFHRALDSKSEVQHGTGLGLSIAQTLAQRMRGELIAKSDGPGKGSRFTLWLEEAGP